ncbi:MAG: DegT/DnrJ/EryC1/StrS family aminotransferase [Lachnospiraceae bacterium]|nr:DegT/DnrJ/EryC1/StrS family aminotransferase [Lachnospiraceae bacterium]
MKVPFFDVKRQYEIIKEDVEEAVVAVMRSGQYIEGPAVKELEKEMASYLGVKHVISCANGTDSLCIALKACGVRPGDEVITTAFSFFATAEAISGVGAVPVFADIDEKNFNIDVKDVERKITKATKAILPVHIFGTPADMDELNALGEKYNLPVIEDACQAIGAEYKGKKAGALGTIGCFSFYPTKNLGGFGDGGMITTNDDKLAESCRALKAHAAGKLGARAYQNIYKKEVPELAELESMSGDNLYDPCKYYNYFIGQNSRLDSIQAAVLHVKLGHLESFNANRTAIAKEYNERLAETPLVLPPFEYDDRKSCWHQYAVLTEDKEGLSKFLGEKGIGTGSFYPVPLHLQKAFQELGYEEGSLEVAEDTCKKSVCLPVFPEMTKEEVDYVIASILEYYN